MARETMQAIRVYQYGGPEQLILEELPRPEPQADEVLVRIYAAGVLPVEWKIRSGAFQGPFAPGLPYAPGSSVAGIVEAVGSDVTTFQPGDAVFGRSNRGAYAEYTTVAVETLAHKPEN